MKNDDWIEIEDIWSPGKVLRVKKGADDTSICQHSDWDDWDDDVVSDSVKEALIKEAKNGQEKSMIRLAKMEAQLDAELEAQTGRSTQKVELISVKNDDRPTWVLKGGGVSTAELIVAIDNTENNPKNISNYSNKLSRAKKKLNNMLREDKYRKLKTKLTSWDDLLYVFCRPTQLNSALLQEFLAIDNNRHLLSENLENSFDNELKRLKCLDPTIDFKDNPLLFDLMHMSQDPDSNFEIISFAKSCENETIGQKI